MITLQKKQYIGLLALCAVVLFFVFRNDSHTVPLAVYTYEEKEGPYEISIAYPQFSRVKKSFNKEIESTINDALAKFRESSAETESVRNTPAGKGMPEYVYTFSARWTPEEITSEFISFAIHTSYFTGGAHGGEEIYTFNYDIREKKIITLEDIFAGSPNYLVRISEFVLSDLKSQLRTSTEGLTPDDDMLTVGTAPTLENYKNFTLGSHDTVTFYFPQYQVAPYAAGEQTVTMPLSYIISNPQ